MTTPKLIVFEGGDGSGKTSLLDRTEGYLRQGQSAVDLLKAWFPGKEPGTIGELIYSLHHGRLAGMHEPDPVSMQIMHMAAHVDQARRVLLPHLAGGGTVLLDRSWWSTYAYSRFTLDADACWNLVQLERPFWADGPPPVIFFLRRDNSLKPEESDQARHRSLLSYYQEVIDRQRSEGVEVHIIDNNGTEEQAFIQIKQILGGGPHDPCSSKFGK